MTFSQLVKSFPWSRLSKKVLLRIDLPYCIGVFTQEDADARGLHLAQGSQGSIADGNRIQFYWLVDKSDGVIIDARFQAFGNTALIGAAEVACELLVGKTMIRPNVSRQILSTSTCGKSLMCPHFPRRHLDILIL